MSIGSSGTRVSNALLAQLFTRNINNNMRQLLDLQHQLGTGLRLYRPSVDPAAAAAAMSLQSLMERREQAGTNIDRGNGFLAATDNALADLLDIVNQAASLASSNIGAGSDDEMRQDAAAMVDGLIDQVVLLGNRRVQGRYLFAGRAGQEAPFEVSETGVRFVGDISPLETILDSSITVANNVTADQAFGTLSGRVESLADLNPAVTLGTRLSELNGGQGLKLGTILLGDGTNTARVDLSGGDTVGDIISAINNNGLVGVTAAINAAGDGLVLTAGPSGRISVDDLPGGFTARNLGLLQTSALGAGTALVGADLDRTLSLMTELTALRGGTGIDTAGGLRITVGDDTATIDLSAARTVEDLLNAINYSGLFVRASIDSDGRRLVVANTVANGAMSVGENGGASAAELGIRTMHGGTLLSDLNSGRGVRTVAGSDLEIVSSSGRVIGIDVSDLATLEELIKAINSDAANGGRVRADFNALGNGIRLTDNTWGPGDFQVRGVNDSLAAGDLGIEAVAGDSGRVLNGIDVAGVQEQGVFGHLYALRDALLASDDASVSQAGSALQDEAGRVARTRGAVGARMQLLDSARERVEDEMLQIESLLSETRDLDYAEAISRLQVLQATFQASLQVTANILPLSLMDFLRF